MEFEKTFHGGLGSYIVWSIYLVSLYILIWWDGYYLNGTQNIGDVIVAEILSNPMKWNWFKQNSIAFEVVGVGIGQRI